VTKSIIVSSTKGGTGKTLTALNIARRLQDEGINVGLIDSDMESSNFREFTKAKGQIKINKKQKTFIPYDWDGIQVFSMSLLDEKNRAVSMTGKSHRRIINDIVDQTEWSNRDTFIIDLPSGASDILKECIYAFGNDLAGGIVVMQPINEGDAERIIKLHRINNVPVLGIIENMAYFKVPYGKGEKTYYVFGEPRGEQIAEEKDVEFLGQVPLTSDIAEGIEEGNPILEHDDEAFENAADAVKSAKTISIFGRLKQKIKGSIKGLAERVLANFVLNANKVVDIGEMQDRHNFHERRPIDFVIVSEDRTKVLSRTHMQVKNGKLLVKKEIEGGNGFEISLTFSTLAKIICGKEKIDGEEYEYDVQDAWSRGDLRVYGEGSSPRLVDVARDLFNEKQVEKLREKFGGKLKRFI